MISPLLFFKRWSEKRVCEIRASETGKGNRFAKANERSSESEIGSLEHVCCRRAESGSSARFAGSCCASSVEDGAALMKQGFRSQKDRNLFCHFYVFQGLLQNLAKMSKLAPSPKMSHMKDVVEFSPTVVIAIDDCLR